MADESAAPVAVEEAAPVVEAAEPAAAEAVPAAEETKADEAMETDAAAEAAPAAEAAAKPKGKGGRPKKAAAEKKAPAPKKTRAPAAEKKAPAAAAAKPAAKAAKKPAAAKAPSAHPPYLEMAISAIQALKERNGSSRQAILKYVMATFNVGSDAKVVNVHLKQALKRGVTTEALKNTKVRFGPSACRLPVRCCARLWVLTRRVFLLL